MKLSKKKFLKIVLTGGPLAGKTSVLPYIRDYFGDQVKIIPEIPTLFEHHVFKDNLFFAKAYNKKINKLFFVIQELLEDLYVFIAKKEGIRLIICDRGLLDGAAYFAGGAKSFLRFHNVAPDNVYKKYDAIIWMETLVKTDKRKSLLIRNLTKGAVTEALDISNNNLSIWQNHPHFYQVTGKNVKVKGDRVLEIIDSLLNN